MTTHTGNRPYKCSSCSDSFINKNLLDRHMRFHGVPMKYFRCEYCFMELTSGVSLKRHVQRKHKMTAVCEICRGEFPTREELKLHLKTHGPYFCEYCNKKFVLPRYLKMHYKTHFSEDGNRIDCPFCPKNYKENILKSHIFKVHSENFDAWRLKNPTI